MWPHTACGIETYFHIRYEYSIKRHMWPHTACGIENRRILQQDHNYQSVTCGLIPLAVLKQSCAQLRSGRPSLVTCGLIPLAVLKPPFFIAPKTSFAVTCDLIPLAVLKQSEGSAIIYLAHVTCDLIPLAVLKPDETSLIIKPKFCHMWPHTACGIETWVSGSSTQPFVGHMWPHTACGIETYPTWLVRTPLLGVACDLIPLAVCHTKREPFGSLFVCLLRSSHRFQ